MDEIPFSEQTHWCPWCDKPITYVGAAAGEHEGDLIFTGCDCTAQSLHWDRNKGDCWCDK